MQNCTLPATGGSTAMIVLVGFAAILAGVVAVRLGRPRALPVVIAVALAVGAIGWAAPARAVSNCPVPTVATSLAPATSTTEVTTTVATTPPTTSTTSTSTSTTTSTTPPTTSTTSTSTSTTTSTTSTTSSTTTTTSTTTSTTVAPQPPIAVDDSFTVVVGVPTTFNYYANDSLFGLTPGLGSSWFNGTCQNANFGQPATGSIIINVPVIGVCTMNYTVATAAGSDSAVITVIATPAVPA